ncbi:hypothetical protein LWI29_020024 [Acer saccharum]|uniref:Uncharacterized protein n=1 Tax=Acer saccharum TaxID=4024 RepID=A0AA39V9R6_ACESA|nr:hypothetical protein LWI29_020024 [Acer saccharum]
MLEESILFHLNDLEKGEKQTLRAANPINQFSKRLGGGRSEKFNHGGSRRPYNRVDDARWYNQHSSVKKGDLRPPEAGARGGDKGVRIRNHEDSNAKIAGDKCGINLNSNLKEDCT